MAKERNLTLEEFSRVAAGDEDIDKLIDDKLREEAEKGNAVIDGQLAAWMAGDNADLNILLILRVVAQSEWTTREEIVNSLQIPATDVTGALRLATARGWLESEDGRFRLTWQWFRSITRVLARKNLLVRTTLGE